MSFFNLQETHHHLHHHHQTRSDEHDRMDSRGSTTVIRSYDCVFCQRGFTTAQALGGHMNIHRKDRANPTTKSNIISANPNYNKEPTNNNTILISNHNKEMLLEEEEEEDYEVNQVVDTRLVYSSNNYLNSQNHHINNGSGGPSFEGRVHRFLGSSEKSSSSWADHNPSLRGGSGHMVGKRVQDHDHGHSHEGEELDLELRLGQYSW